VASKLMPLCDFPTYVEVYSGKNGWRQPKRNFDTFLDRPYMSRRMAGAGDMPPCKGVAISVARSGDPKYPRFCNYFF
jgi:hypothetical protein